MSINGTTASGKTPVHERDDRQPYHERRLVNVQPARVDDLQPKYAQTIQHDEENPEAHGWYASCSKCNVQLLYGLPLSRRSALTS